MAQVKIYDLKEHLNAVKTDLSNVIHRCLMEALELPAEKRFQRFFPLDADNFLFPADRSSQYTIIEISLFEGRSIEAKKDLIRSLFERSREISISRQDLEITLLESPPCNWGIRGLSADELTLHYKVKV